MDSASYIKIQKVERVIMDPHVKHGADYGVVGTLFFTAHHLIFSAQSGNQEVFVLYMLIDSVEKKAGTGKGTPLVIRCKNFRVLHFVIPKAAECQSVYDSLQYLAFPARLEHLYVFTKINRIVSDGKMQPGWDTYNAVNEFRRIGLPSDKWVLTDLNSDYKLCPTYSRWLGVPASVERNVIIGSAKFRSKGRLPVLSYVYGPTQASITRCSQPLAGVKNKRCLEDELLVQAIFNANPNKGAQHYIVDARPRVNAMANRAGGAGYESVEHYTNCRCLFMGIENIHVMRDSLNRFLDATQTTDATSGWWLSALDASGWLRHIKGVLDAAVLIVRAVTKEGSSVVVHCSDGWDRTAQLCSLSTLLIDPYYRTIKGLIILIEKEWLAFGHKFGDRCGQLTKDHKERSPIFTQFLECVWQIMQQFPPYFEYNERFLIALHDGVYSCEYGTFLGNCENFRWREKNLPVITDSLWPALMARVDEFTNPMYSALI
eukprot:Opistho-2@70202